MVAKVAKKAAVKKDEYGYACGTSEEYQDLCDDRYSSVGAALAAALQMNEGDIVTVWKKVGTYKLKQTFEELK